MSTTAKEEDATPKPEDVSAPVETPNPPEQVPTAPAPTGQAPPPAMPVAPGPAPGAPPAQMPMGQVAPSPGMPPVQQPARLPPPAGAPPQAIVPPGVSLPPGNNPAEQPLLPPQQGQLGGALPMGPGAAPAGQPQPYRQLKVEDALAYLDQVKMKFEKQPHIYNKFLDIMKEFKAQSIDTPGVIDRVLQLFHGHRELILGFNTFLPPGYKIEFSDDESKPRVQLKYPQGMTGPQPQGFAAMQHPQPTPQPIPGPMPGPIGGGPVSQPPGWLGDGPGGPSQMPGHGLLGVGAPPSAPAQKKAPIEFDQAINYVTKIKTRFAKQPETYKAFLEILHTYQKEQKTIKEVYEQVSTLFKNHTDLLGEFSQFLPDGSPEGGGLLGPKGGKGKGLGGMMGGPLGGIKQPVPQRPNSKPGQRGADDEEERFWQKRKNAGRKDDKRPDVRSSPEAEFFSKCRNRMPKPLYLELLKSLNLYSQQIVDRAELLTLVHDLFKRTHPELFVTFRRLLGYSGGAEPRDAPSPPAASQAPAAEGGNFRDLDFTTMRRQGTSYRILPDTYAMPTCSGRGPLETLVLNDCWVSVATGTEDLNFKTMRKNQYEESIFRAEDERFELDTTIETNFATIQMLQPIAAEIATLSEQEKRRYKLPTPLTAMHQKSIRRLYGAQGSPVIELLQKCPAAAAGALLKRLQQKDEEWRQLRIQCSKSWKEVYEKNYTKSLDHRSFYFKQGDKKNFSGKQMVMELKALTETSDSEKNGEAGEAAAAAAAAAAAQQQQQQQQEGGPSASTGSLTLPFTIKNCSLPTLHDDSMSLMTFAAKLNFSVFEGEIDEKIEQFWDEFIRKFFVCPDLPAADGAAAASDAMDVDGPKTKPLLVVAAGDGEELATRDARPPDQRWAMPLTYPKTSSQLFIGNSHFYIFSRLYHLIVSRLDFARGMAAEAQAEDKANGKEEAASGASAAASATANGIAPNAAAAGVGGASADQVSRVALIAQLRSEAKGDLYVAFTSCLKQVIEGKMEASTYEDVLRTLLGTNAYLLFTLHKIISQALKQLQMLLVEDVSTKLLELYEYERQRASAGSMSEATYRSNARMILEGDDCFRVEQMYSAGDWEAVTEEKGNGGGLMVAFLPEKEEEDDDDVEELDEDEEEDADEAGKAETVAYMQAFMQCTRAPSLPARSGRNGQLLLKSAMRTPSWTKALNRPGLECRSAVGSCKLRFVSRSEDLWFSNVKRPAAKRASRSPGGSQSKRQKLGAFLEGRLTREGPNALAGQPAATPAPLPREHTLKPIETPASAS